MLLLVVRLIYSFHMPLFIALSGALYQYGLQGGTEDRFGKLCMKKFRRLILPFLGTLLFWLLPLKFFAGYYQNSPHPIQDMFWGQVVFLDNCHLWYLLSLFWIFLIAWLLDHLTENKYIKTCIILCFFVIGCLMSKNIFGIPKALRYVVYFYIGRAFEQKRIALAQLEGKKKKLLVSGTILFTLIVYGAYLFLFKNNEIIYGIVALAGMSLTILLVLLMKRLNVSLDHRVTQGIIQYSFAIYLFSDPVNYVILAILVHTGAVKYYTSHLFCFGIFVGRIIITTAVAVFVQIILNRIKRTFGKGSEQAFEIDDR